MTSDSAPPLPHWMRAHYTPYKGGGGLNTQARPEITHILQSHPSFSRGGGGG